MIDLPASVAELVNELATTRGVVAVALGGSRVTEPSAVGADWDLGVYYRGTLDLAALEHRGTVYPPGTWGRLMNGGAWLQCGGERVDVLLRDLDAVDHWTERASRGEFEVDALLGYLAGVPTYLLTAELASCQPLCGELPTVAYPPKLAAAAPPRWRFCRTFSLDYARVLASRGNRVGAVGQTAKAVMEEGHAVMCEQRRWVCNEKRLIDAAGLASMQTWFEAVPAQTADLLSWIDEVGAQLGRLASEIMPWETTKS